jgi:histidine triad (HIT) family protein
MKKDDCIFCKIANGEIPAATLYEDEMFRVILDLNPASKGHALILPKDHAANLFELPEEDIEYFSHEIPTDLWLELIQ